MLTPSDNATKPSGIYLDTTNSVPAGITIPELVFKSTCDFQTSVVPEPSKLIATIEAIPIKIPTKSVKIDFILSLATNICILCQHAFSGYTR